MYRNASAPYVHGAIRLDAGLTPPLYGRGEPGKDGIDGRNGINGIAGGAGAAGAAGTNGRNGRDGIDGRDALDGTGGIVYTEVANGAMPANVANANSAAIDTGLTIPPGTLWGVLAVRTGRGFWVNFSTLPVVEVGTNLISVAPILDGRSQTRIARNAAGNLVASTARNVEGYAGVMSLLIPTATAAAGMDGADGLDRITVGVVNAVNGRLPSNEVLAIRLGWAQALPFVALDFARVGNHPLDGAVLGTTDMLLAAPPFPPALVGDADLWLGIWLQGVDVQASEIYFDTLDNPQLSTEFIIPADGLPLTVDGVEGRYWYTSARIIPTDESIGVVLPGDLIATQDYVLAAVNIGGDPMPFADHAADPDAHHTPTVQDTTALDDHAADADAHHVPKVAGGGGVNMVVAEISGAESAPANLWALSGLQATITPSTDAKRIKN